MPTRTFKLDGAELAAVGTHLLRDLLSAPDSDTSVDRTLRYWGESIDVDDQVAVATSALLQLLATMQVMDPSVRKRLIGAIEEAAQSLAPLPKAYLQARPGTSFRKY